ncbi:MAG: hypothetical protein SCALA702_38150 [Melioribacteraceae bacterium]|nr:MAG: hypothetical protein SCALA702_38150 [Melioribacteraceae bacterium]
MKILSRLLLTFLFLSTISFGQTYLDSNATVQERVDDLIGRMTLDEKLGQMIQADHKAVGDLNDMLTYHIGSILSGGGSDPDAGNSPANWADLKDLFQQKAMGSRLGIPIIYGIDAVHGHSNVEGAVIFPHNIGLGATGDPELIKEAARITAVEMRATGMDWTFAPCVAVPRDERWGRTYEGFGETPELAQMYGAPAVEGFQGETLNSFTSVVACAKHYLGDGGTTNGVDQGNTQLSEADLRAIHLPGYISAIEQDVKTVMISYSSWNGNKMHGHDYMINDVLKDELGFEGFVVSDWAGIDQLPGDYRSDVKASVNAGIDMVMVPNNYADFFNNLKSLVNNGEVTADRIDDAVRRILAIKFEMGLFEHPYAIRSLLATVGSEEHRAVAREAVRKSAVMLKKSDDVLPIPKSGVKILVAGEHADNIGLQCGGWTIQWQGASGDITEGTTILEGIQNAAPSAEIIYSEDGSYDGDDIDFIVAAIGEEPYAEGDGDKDDLNLQKSQVQMIRELQLKGAPVITILISGRPMIIDPVLHNSDVFISAFLPGTEGDGISDILFGDYNPSGLLPMSFPKNMAQIPLNVGDADYDPLFEYQFGITSLDNSALGSDPVFYTAMLTEDAGQIELSFNKSMNNLANSTAVFKVMVNGNDEVAVDGFSVADFADDRLLLELAENIQTVETITVEYISGDLKSEDGGTLQPFTADVINFPGLVPQSFFLPGLIEAEDYHDMFGVQTEGTSDVGGGLNVGWIDTGDWMEYNSDLMYTGTYVVKFRVASESAGGTISFKVDGSEKFQQNIPVTGGWQNWQTSSGMADLDAGEMTIRLHAAAGGFNLNWFELTALTDLDDDDRSTMGYRLEQNYPNPFNPSTNISFSLKERSFVTLKVFDVLGREIEELVNQEKSAGSFDIQFDASQLTSGIYFYSISAEGISGEKYHSVNKMMLMK